MKNMKYEIYYTKEDTDKAINELRKQKQNFKIRYRYDYNKDMYYWIIYIY